MLPLLHPDQPLRTLAWCGGRAVSQRQFLRDVGLLAARLPQATHALNLCSDRYRFMVAFAAVCLRGQTNLLPPSQAPGMIGEIAAAYPGCYALGETTTSRLPLTWISVDPDETPVAAGSFPVPVLPADHAAALVFSSGSTGQPQAHAKTWQGLVTVARLTRERLLGDEPSVASIVATVPAQHMYGLETTVMLALAGGCAAHAGPAFLPADLCAALREVPAPRVLITTPVHLRACLAAALPPLQLIVSATAPLSQELAATVETAMRAPVQEIYGCTEAGSMATRRMLASPAWQLFPGMQLQRHQGRDFVHGPQLATPVPLPDVVEDLGHGRFRLGERNTDMLKVAGKRASLTELTARLLRIPGVLDAVVFVPEAARGLEARPAALVVAPELSERQILAALQLTIDAVFLPRPLIRVPELPRNAVGKLPRAALLAALERGRA